MMTMGQAVSVPPWSQHVPVSGDDDDEMSLYLLTALRHQYLPCNDPGVTAAKAADEAPMVAGVDSYDCDEFRMYQFKVRRCTQARSHDWTKCPFAHPGEKAHRRDPRKYHYSGTACPDFRKKGGCKRGDNCDFAHGVFECWLHPARYRTQPCKDGIGCRRRVCFFAHTAEQLRVLPAMQHQRSIPRGAVSSPLEESYDGSPLRRQAYESYLAKSIMCSSPTITLMSPPMSPPSEFPPLLPNVAAGRGCWPGVGSPVNDEIAALRQLRLSKANSSPSGGWGGYRSASAVAYGSPTAGGLHSLPSTPIATRTTLANLEPLEVSFGGGKEPVERVDSGLALRAKMFEQLSSAGSHFFGNTTAGNGGPEVGWVSELIN